MMLDSVDSDSESESKSGFKDDDEILEFVIGVSPSLN